MVKGKFLICCNGVQEKRYLMGVSVLMPGQDFPTFIANPAPMNQCHEAYVDDGNPSGQDRSRQEGH